MQYIACKSQESCDERRTHIAEQCESMINEIQSKRDFFIADIDYEQKVKAEGIGEYVHGIIISIAI